MTQPVTHQATQPTASERLYERAVRYTPTGTHSNTRIRSPHPHYVQEAHGAYLTDVDGRELLDFVMGNGSVILGHDHPAVRDAVRRAVDQGNTTGHETPDAVAVVELLAELIPGMRAIRFANTGTEAVMHALRVARAATGRPAVAKAEAAYHGWADQVWVSTWPPLAEVGSAARPRPVPGAAGLSGAAGTTVVLPFNDLAATERLLREHAADLAAVIVEPVLIDIGFVPATQSYVDLLRSLTEELGILLVFDEMLTGFRIAPGGAREAYGITPDLSIHGKAIANGYPLAAVEGRRDLLDLTDPARGEVGWVGTYNAHAIALAAARATLSELRSGEVHRQLVTLTDTLRTGVAELAERHGTPVTLAGQAGHFQPYFRAEAPHDYRSAMAADLAAYRALARTCDDRAVIIPGNPLGHCALSVAHTHADLARFLECVDLVLAASSLGES